MRIERKICSERTKCEGKAIDCMECCGQMCGVTTLVMGQLPLNMWKDRN